MTTRTLLTRSFDELLHHILIKNNILYPAWVPVSLKSSRWLKLKLLHIDSIGKLHHWISTQINIDSKKTLAAFSTFKALLFVARYYTQWFCVAMLSVSLLTLKTIRPSARHTSDFWNFRHADLESLTSSYSYHEFMNTVYLLSTVNGCSYYLISKICISYAQ